MSSLIVGNVWKFGDSIDTDVIIAAEYLRDVKTDPKELASHAMAGVDPDFSKKVKQGDVMVAGKNFGTGSSRERAPVAIKYTGISAIVAESFARIFYRNAINVGLPCLECEGIASRVKQGDRLEIHVETGEVKNLTTGDTLKATPIPEFLMQLIRDGGLVPHLKKTGIKGKAK